MHLITLYNMAEQVGMVHFYGVTEIYALAPGWFEWNFNISPGHNGRHFSDDIFRCIFVNEKFSIVIKIPLKFVPKGPSGNNPALV